MPFCIVVIGASAGGQEAICKLLASLPKRLNAAIFSPSENRWRPSIYVLFRSAAVYYRERTIGIVLTCMLDDGTSGMKAIKKCGGTCIVQDPAEATYPDMPQSVIDNSAVDYILGVSAMGEAIQETIAGKKLTGAEVPGRLWRRAVRNKERRSNPLPLSYRPCFFTERPVKKTG